MYLIRRKSDNRLISGLFSPIETEAQALRVLEQWEYNYPSMEFVIDVKSAKEEEENTLWKTQLKT